MGKKDIAIGISHVFVQVYPTIYMFIVSEVGLYIHLFLAVKMGAAICNFYGSSFQSHLRPAIFSCTKQFDLVLDIEHL